MGSALQDQGKLDAAVQSYEPALALKPDYAEAHGNLGTALVTLGRIDEACQCFERAVKLTPRSPRFHQLLSGMKKFTADDPQLADLRALAREVDSFSEAQQIDLHFALGKACDGIGAREEAFRHYLSGNALKPKHLGYDERKWLDRLEHVRLSFAPAIMESHAGSGDPSPVPIFIVGMPRSGSTLIEQILASHPKVHGAGELNNFEDEIARIDPKAIFDGVPSTEALHAVGTRYLSALRVRAPDAVRITDKMLGNFRYAGLIHLALPNARIIHSRPDPIDTLLSCFCTLFDKSSLPFTYDLVELGRHYRAYQRMMDHWRTVLPEGVMLEIDYEELVDDLEGQARRIVAHCGLDWDDACLSFHKTQRPVSTASALQVRQPIYRSSVGRWRPDAEVLRPLTDALRAGRDA
jgi:tetratricopeptide (TPR) repeat protein